jgi:itaconate CoA-transferase
MSSYFVWLNRGKRSLTLNLKSDEGRALLTRLLAGADVFIQNLGPGVADRLGLAAATLREQYPRLVVCELSGYGSTGPYRDRKAFDLLLQGESGLISTTGSADAPAKIGISIGDVSAGMYAFSSILAALYDREKTGVGRTIETAMLDCLAEWMNGPAYFWMYGGIKLERAGWRHNIIVPYGPYRCGDGQYVNLAVQNEGQWRRLCTGVLQRPDLVDDARFSSNELRLKNRTELEPLIESILAASDRATVEARLAEFDVPFGSLNEVDDLVDHPQLAARNRWLEVDSPVGPIKTLAHPLNLSDMPQRADPVPGLGQHTDEIAAELGYSAEAIAALHASGAV